MQKYNVKFIEASAISDEAMKIIATKANVTSAMTYTTNVHTITSVDFDDNTSATIYMDDMRGEISAITIARANTRVEMIYTSHA